MLAGADNLDRPEIIQRLDRAGLLDLVSSFDQQAAQALKLVRDFQPKSVSTPILNVLVCGLGGSAIGGDFVRVWAGEQLKVPFVVNRDYRVPGFVGPWTVAIIISYSGNTEETLSTLRLCHSAGAQVFCISSGGELCRRAARDDLSLLQIPAGLPPRFAFPFMSVALLGLLGRLGIVANGEPEIEQSIPFARERIEALVADRPAEENVAKKLAFSLNGKIPLVYGSSRRLDVVAIRWANQFSENAKQMAFFNALPEMNHNEIMGWAHPATLIKDLVPIFLRDRGDHAKVQDRFEITRDLLQDRGLPALEFWTEGESWLQRLWSLILLGDFASLYLAILNGEDPAPVPIIESLKQRLRNR